MAADIQPTFDNVRSILWCDPSLPSERHLRQLQFYFGKRTKYIAVTAVRNTVTVTDYRQCMSILRNQRVSEIVLPFNQSLFQDLRLHIGLIPLYLNINGDIMPYENECAFETETLPYAHRTNAKRASIVLTQRKGSKIKNTKTVSYNLGGDEQVLIRETTLIDQRDTISDTVDDVIVKPSTVPITSTIMSEPESEPAQPKRKRSPARKRTAKVKSEAEADPKAKPKRTRRIKAAATA